jgi:YrbI family 3-deoxy-D-manno-octulosonate 8-phosphate phosphatase
MNSGEAMIEGITLNPEVAERVRRVRLVGFDFDGVFTDNSVYVFEDGREAVRCSRADGIGLAKLARFGVGAVIISTEVNPVVSARAKKLGVLCVQGCEDKPSALERILGERNLTFDQAAFVGNDVNDLTCLEKVHLPIVVQDAHPDVASVATYRTRAPGGYGAVREVCDIFEQVLGFRDE